MVKRNSPREMRGFHRKWQGGMPFRYGLLNKTVFRFQSLPQICFDTQVFMFLFKVIQFSIIM